MEGQADGARILGTQEECCELVERMEETLSDEQIFRPSQVKSLRACLMIFRDNLRRFDEFLSQIAASEKPSLRTSKRDSVLNSRQFYKSRELLNAYESALLSLRGLNTVLNELKAQSGLSRFFSSLSLRKRFDVAHAQLTECMQVLLERQTETRLFEHRK